MTGDENRIIRAHRIRAIRSTHDGVFSGLAKIQGNVLDSNSYSDPSLNNMQGVLNLPVIRGIYRR